MSMNHYVVLENGDEVPESVDSKAFAWHSSDLEVMARDLGLRPLCDFEVDYGERLADIPSDEDIEENETERMMTVVGADDLWFDPNEALESARGLIQHIETGSRWIPGWWHTRASESLQLIQPVGPAVGPIDFRVRHPRR